MRFLLFYSSFSFFSFWAIGQECSTYIQLDIQTDEQLPPQVFMASDLNSWSPSDPSFQFTDDEYPSLRVHGACGSEVQFKICFGPGWEFVEKNSQGGDIGNRKLILSNDTVQLSTYYFKAEAVSSTATNNVVRIDSSFYSTTEFSRPIWLHLPESYHSSKKKYRVLYMHDGQNLFDDSRAFSGEWHVDESLRKLEKEGIEIIVVAIDNSGADRINDYSFWENSEYGGGQGREYMNFIVKELKPFIDKEYRTKKGAKNTGIAGSSLGALISYSAWSEYPEVFGNVGLLSPAFWFNPEVKELELSGKRKNAELFFSAGMNESDNMLQLISEMQQLIAQQCKKCIIHTEIDPEGTHSEAMWSEQFPMMMRFLFYY